jgi:hypothetical protein
MSTDFIRNTKVWTMSPVPEFVENSKIEVLIGITPIPILTGNHIVFPCGAIQYNGDFIISMGIQYKNTDLLKVLRDLDFISI